MITTHYFKLVPDLEEIRVDFCVPVNPENGGKSRKTDIKTVVRDGGSKGPLIGLS